MSPKPSVFDFQTLAAYFRAMLEYRKGKNPSYSRKAFARALGISGPMFTYILQGVRSISPETVTKTAEKLKLGEREEEYLGLLAQSVRAADAGHVEKLARRMRGFRRRAKPIELPLESFAPIARWYVLALLEICAIAPLGEGELPGVAKSLRVPRDDLEHALVALHRLGLVGRDASGTYSRLPGEVLVNVAAKRSEVDQFHSQVLAKARASVASEDPRDRVYASVFYAIRKAKVPELREKIYALLDELHDEALAESAPDAVYGFSTAFFRVFDGGTP